MLEVKGTAKHDPFKLRSRIGSAFVECKGGNVHVSVNILFKFSLMIRVDNVGAIFAQYVSATSCAKHMDIRCKYVNKYIEDEMVQMVFVCLLIMTSIFLQRT